jgi:hypothetical protein
MTRHPFGASVALDTSLAAAWKADTHGSTVQSASPPSQSTKAVGGLMAKPEQRPARERFS